MTPGDGSDRGQSARSSPSSAAAVVPVTRSESEAPEPVEGWPGASLPRRFGNYLLLEKIDEGGMGVVYKARQQSPDRFVALKMIQSGQLATEEHVRRFRQEADQAAGLDHAHVVPVYDFGELGGQHYFTMKLVEGGALSRHLGRFRDDPRAAAQLLTTVARAVHHAHQRGILHRDLKPGNILLDAAGQPHVADFGLAKRLGDVGGVTVSGAVVGTAEYMAPEQAAGRSGLTVAADVYALGGVLYTLLTGHPPFHDAMLLETLRQVLECEPARPRSLNGRVPKDLETICLKCLRKEAAHRYGSAAELADDLERWLRNEPVQARPTSAAERLWRWARRRPAAAAFVASSALCLVALLTLTVSLFYSHDLETQTRTAVERGRKVDRLFRKVQQEVKQKEAALGEAARQKNIAQRQKGKADRALYANHLNAAQHSLAKGDLARAREHLEACRWDLRGWEWDHLHRRVLPSWRELPSDGFGEFSCLCFSGDGQWLAGTRDPGAIVIWHLPEGRVATTLSMSQEVAFCLRFQPDGRHLVSIGRSPDFRGGAVKELVARTWNVCERREVRRVSLKLPEVAASERFCLSPDGGLFAVALEDGSVGLWDTQTGEERRRCRAGMAAPFRPIRPSPEPPGFKGLRLPVPCWHVDRVTAIGFSQDGKRLAGSLARNVICFWDVRTGQEQGQISLAHDLGDTRLVAIEQIVFSPRGLQLAALCNDTDPRVLLWDLQTGSLDRAEKVERGWGRLVFNPDGQYLLVVPPNPTGFAELIGCRENVKHTGWARKAARFFGPPAEEGSLQKKNAILLPIPVFGLPQFECVCFSPDGTLLAGSAVQAGLVDMRGAGLPPARPLPDPLVGGSQRLPADSYRLSPDGTALAAVAGHSLLLESLADGRRKTLLDDFQLDVNDVRFSADGRWLACCCVRIDRERFQKPAGGGAYFTQHVRIGPPTRMEVKLWDLRTGQSQLGYLKAWPSRIRSGPSQGGPPGTSPPPLPGMPAPAEVSTSAAGAICLSPDGRDLVVVDRVNEVLLLRRNWASHCEEVELQGHSTPSCAVFSPDGSLLASGDAKGAVTIWDPASGHELRTLAGLTARVRVLCFGSGRRLAGTDDAGVLKVWDTACVRPLVSVRGRHWTLNELCWSSDQRCLTGIEPWGGVHTWDAQTGEEVFSLEADQDPIGEIGTNAGAGFRIVTRSGAVEELAWKPRPCQHVLAEALARDVAFSFSPGGKNFLWRYDDGEVCGLDLATGEDLDARTLEGFRLPPIPPAPQKQRNAVRPLADLAVKRLQDPAGRWEARLEGAQRLALHRLHESRKAARRLQAQQPSELRWHRLAAEAAEKGDDWFAARFHVDQLLRQAPDRPDLHQWRLRLDAGGQDWPQLADDYLAVVARLEEKAWGGWQSVLNQFSSAAGPLLAELDRRLRQDARPWQVWAGRAWLRLQRGESGAAVADLAEAVRRCPRCPALVWHLVVAAVNARDLDRADAEYPRLAALVAADALAHWHRGEFAQLWRKAEWGATRWHLTRLLAYPSAGAEEYWRRGWVNVYLGRWQEAAGDSAAALERDGSRSEFYYLRSLATLRTGDLAGYRRSCAELLKRFGQTKDATTALCAAQDAVFGPGATGDWAVVVDLAGKACRGLPKDRRAAWTLGAALYRAGRLREANERLQQALTQRQQGEVPFWAEFFAAMTCHRLGQTAEARRWLERARAWGEEPVREHLRTAAAMVGGLPASPLTSLATFQLLAAGKTGKHTGFLTAESQVLWEILQREATHVCPARPQLPGS